MKKSSLAFALAIMVWLTPNAWAQNPKTARTDAALSYQNYKTDASQLEELKRAKASIDVAAAHEKMQSDAQTFRLKGRIYASISRTEGLATEHPKAAIEAQEAFFKALDIEEAALVAKNKPKSKVGSQSEFREGFVEIAFGLYNAGVDAIRAKKHEAAYNNFSRILWIKPRCAEFTAKTPLIFKQNNFEIKDGDVALLAIEAGTSWAMESKNAELLPKLEKMIQDHKAIIAEKEMPRLFARLVAAYNAAGKVGEAKKALAEARKAYPSNLDLLIAQINMAAAEGKLVEVEDELKKAIEAEPGNAELHFALGGVYYQLMNDEIKKEGSATEAKVRENLGKSLDWYGKTSKMDAKHFGAKYNSGVVLILFHNFLLNQLDNLKTSDPKYKAIEKEAQENFDRGVALLHEAEKINPNDLMLLNSLKEVYSRKNDSENFMKYKKLFEENQAKGRN
jgi:Flp pilus assembly protein TadD